MEVIDLHHPDGYKTQMDINQIRLRKLRQLELEAGGRSELADRLGMSYSLLSSYIGKNPSKNIGAKTARHAEVVFSRPNGWMDKLEAQELESWRESVMADLPDDLLNEADEDRRRRNRRQLPDRRDTNELEIPYWNVTASMGLGAGALIPDFERPVGSMNVDVQWLRRNVSFTATTNLALIDSRGDSMAGTFNDGDVLLVDRGVTRTDLDAIYVLARGDVLYIKRLQRMSDDTFLMISDNPLYRPVEIKLDGGSDFRVLGRVVGSWNWKKL